MKLLKKNLPPILFFLLLSSTLLAQQDVRPSPSLTMGVNFSSTFFWRGIDRNASLYAQEKSLFFSPVIQPELTVFTPLRGLYFDLFATFPLRDRKKITKTNDQLNFALVYDFHNRTGFWLFSYTLYSHFTTGKNFGEFLLSYQLPVSMVEVKASLAGLHSFKESSGSFYADVSLGRSIAKFFTPTLLLGWHMLPQGRKKSWGHVDLILPFDFYLAKNKVNIKLNSIISYRFQDKLAINQKSAWKFVFNIAAFYSI